MIRMSRTNTMSALTCSVLLLAAFGCAQNAPNGSDYLLTATRPGAAVVARGDGVLEVRRFSIDAEFAHRGLVYRTGDYTFERDAYREFLVSPAQMITERTRNWLSLSGLFDQVLVPGSRLRPTLTLEGNVVALYADVRQAEAPTAVVELRCFVIADEGSSQQVVFARNYRSVKPLPADTTEGLIETLDACLAEILTNLETGLAETLAKPSA
jgi:hypothetical protein